MSKNVILCSIYDSAVKAYLQPFFQRTRGEALRSFRAAVNEEGHNFQVHAADYTLFVIGEFDEDTGKLIPYDTPDNLGKAIEHLDKPKAPLLAAAD